MTDTYEVGSGDTTPEMDKIRGKKPKYTVEELCDQLKTAPLTEEQVEAVEEDMVDNPAHYNRFGIECIDAIEASMTTEEFQGMLKGNTIKYLWRYKYKEKPLQDLEKAKWYLDRLIESVKDD